LKVSTGFLLAAGGLLLYSLIRKGAGLATLNIFPGKVQGITFSGFTPILKFGLGVQNTSNQSFTLNSLAGSLYVDSTYVGNISSFVAQTIGPNSQRIIELSAALQSVSIVNEIIRAVETGSFQKTISLKGMANVGGTQIPLLLDFKTGV